ncbi:MAG TPA: DUF4240 domain-containing protein [Candidatus Obscuribacterales bacterium]
MSEHAKIIRFPHRRSIGTLYYAPVTQPEEWELLSQVRALVVSPENQPIKWEFLDEARGTVKVPDGSKVKLKIIAKGATLSPLAECNADDFHVLDLGHSDISDLSLAHIEGLSGLRVLELTSTDVTDRGLKHVGKLTNLTSLGLSHSRVTAEGIKALAGLNKLRELWMSSTGIDDRGLSEIALPESLVQLGLSGTKITDEGLKKLAPLKSLIRVYLFNTQVTREGTEWLKKEIPTVRVKWHPPRTEDDIEAGLDFEGDLDESLLKRMTESFPLLDFSAPSRTLDEDKFWEIIDMLDWENEGDDAKVIEPVVDMLSSMSTQDILAFQDILSEKLFLLDGEDFAREIGLDAYVGDKRTFSRARFLEVRCCVVANGREFFEEVLESPSEMPKDMEFGALLKIAGEAYRRKTNKKLSYTTAYNYETFSNRRGWTHVEAEDRPA